MVRFNPNSTVPDDEVEVLETHPEEGAARYAAEMREGVWFTGLPLAGRWREVLSRFSFVRGHPSDLIRVVEYAELGGRVTALSLEVVDRAADRVFRLRHRGAPFAVRAIDG